MFRSGHTRFVVLLPGVVVKVPCPVFSLIYVMGRVRKHLADGQLNAQIKKTHGNWQNAVLNVSFHLLRGCMISRSEWRFFKKHPDLPIASVYFCFFGLLTIQKRCEEIGEDNRLMWDLFELHVPEDRRRGSDCKQKNFGMLDGRLVCIDYGDRRTQEFLLGEGGAVLRRLNGQPIGDYAHA